MYKLLNEQELRVNEVNVYSGSYLPLWRPGTDYKKCYSANEEMGGGAHLDLVHEIDYVYWLFGCPNKVKSTLRSVSSLEINAIDYAHYNLNYDTFCADITLNYFRKISKREIEILTSEDIWEVNLLSNSVYRNGEEIFKSDQTILDTYEDQMKYFIDLCNEDKVSMNSFEDAIEVMKICLND